MSRKKHDTKEEALADFKSNFTWTDLAESVIDDIFYEFGEETLNWFMADCDQNYGINEMLEIKTNIQKQFLFSVCATNETMAEVTKIYELFPNSQHLIGGMYPEDDIMDKLISKQWLEEFKTWKYPKTSYWALEKSYFFKGTKWDECPKVIQDHFLKIKGE